MPVTRSYDVTFYRAFSTDSPSGRGYVIPNMVGGHHLRTRIDATTLDGLLGAIKNAVERLGYGVVVGVHPRPGTRKPPGFDAATKDLIFNLTPEVK